MPSDKFFPPFQTVIFHVRQKEKDKRFQDRLIGTGGENGSL